MNRTVEKLLVLLLVGASSCTLHGATAPSATIAHRTVTAPPGLTPSPTTTESTTGSTTESTAGSTTGSSDVRPASVPPSLPGVSPPTVRLTALAGTIEAPVMMLSAPQRPDRLWVADKGGRVLALDPATGAVETLIDLSGEISTDNEQGLLGIAVDPAKTVLICSWTDGAGDTVVAAFPLVGGLPDPARRRVLLQVDQPYANHNGGHVVFGPDGFLYLGLGDGGSAGDPQGNGQNLQSRLGKLLRLDIATSGAAKAARGNPFLGGGGDDLIWAYGLRNPWRFSFDRANGDLWIGDVGQDKVEEIDLLPAATTDAGRGANLGWKAFEGTSRFDKSTKAADAKAPLYEYRHADGGCSVTGGYVYRGRAIAALRGWYVYGDYCVDRLSGLAARANGTVEVTDLGVAIPDGKVASFAETADGELYVLAIDPGRIYRVDPA